MKRAARRGPANGARAARRRVRGRHRAALVDAAAAL